MRSQQYFHLPAQLCVARALRVEECRVLVWFPLQRGMEYLLNCL
jgi:hypothetical protein